MKKKSKLSMRSGTVEYTSESVFCNSRGLAGDVEMLVIVMQIYLQIGYRMVFHNKMCLICL